MIMKNFKNRCVALATATLATGFAGHAAAQLTVVSFGGSYQDAQSKALFVPAAKASASRKKPTPVLLPLRCRLRPAP